MNKMGNWNCFSLSKAIKSLTLKDFLEKKKQRMQQDSVHNTLIVQEWHKKYIPFLISYLNGLQRVRKVSQIYENS